MSDFSTLPASQWPVHRLANGAGLSAEVLPTGGLRRLAMGSLLANAMRASPLAPGGPRLWMRRVGEEAAVPLLGPGATPELAAGDDSIRWRGRAGGFAYTVELRLDPSAARWFWIVGVSPGETDTPGDTGKPGETDQPGETGEPIELELLFLASVGLADEGTLRNNEKYVSHYVDHAAFEHGRVGWVQLSRQALRQSTGHPQLMAGCVPRCAGVATDSVALLGTWSKVATPEAGVQRWPAGANLTQHEAAAAGLRSCVLVAGPGRRAEATFFFELVGDHPAASGREDLSRVDAMEQAAAAARQAAAESADRGAFAPVSAAVRGFGAEPWAGRPAAGEDLATWFGPRDDWREVEELQGELASFFCGSATHVATRAKEARLRRGHGHLLRTGDRLLPGDSLATNTVFQRGVFGSHFTLGNTVFGRWSGVVRDELNLDPSAGLRLAVEDATAPGGWRPLGTATAFSTTPGTARWHYRLGDVDGTAEGADAVLQVSLAAAAEGPLFAYAAEWIAGQPRGLRVTCQVSPGPEESGAACEVAVLEDGFAVRPAGENPLDRQGPAPGLQLRFASEAQARFGGDELLTGQGRVGFPWLVAELAAAPACGWTLELCNNLAEPVQLPEQPASPDAFWLDLALRAGFDPGEDPRTRRLAEALPWLVHNAVLHLSTPVGLEQFTGGAWGTRDVCQGPVELLAALGRQDVVAEVLRAVFSHQRQSEGGGVAAGGWPQWFMLPPYADTRAGDAHGDVVVWPLKALADHLRATGNVALLDEPLPWADGADGADGAEPAPLREHVAAALANIEAHSVPGTALMAYGHGDWNDALQPAEPWMAARMVSTWTNALLFETLLGLAATCGDTRLQARLHNRADALAADVHRLLMPAGPDGRREAMGVGIFDESFTRVEPLLHPAATRSVPRHGLISANRGILSGLLAGDDAERHLDMIDSNLLAPDGARLMDRPPAYRGGVSETFQRAESAAFFGREVGLMYTHAHLRYVEVLANRPRPAGGGAGPAGSPAASAVAGAAGAAAARSVGEAAAAGLGSRCVLTELLKVNPVGVRRSVSNALPRQANAYFSSSDAAFPTRHQADRHYAEAMTGERAVEGGWRVYSSGPGIFVRLIVEELLGASFVGAVAGAPAELRLDPRLPADLAGPVTVDLVARGLDLRVVIDPALPASATPTFAAAADAPERALEGATRGPQGWAIPVGSLPAGGRLRCGTGA